MHCLWAQTPKQKAVHNIVASNGTQKKTIGPLKLPGGLHARRDAVLCMEIQVWVVDTNPPIPEVIQEWGRWPVPKVLFLKVWGVLVRIP